MALLTPIGKDGVNPDPAPNGAGEAACKIAGEAEAVLGGSALLIPGLRLSKEALGLRLPGVPPADDGPRPPIGLFPATLPIVALLNTGDGRAAEER